MLQDLKIKHPGIDITDLPGEIDVNEELTSEQIVQLTKLIKQFNDVFNSAGTNPGQVDPQIAVHKIDTADNPPIAHMPYRLTPERRQIVSKMVKDMLEAGIISKSRSPWSSPVVLVPKANGKLRFCVDLRKVNEATVKEIYPLPRIDDTLESLEGAKYFTAFDLASGYWQVPMDPESKKKTAFITHEGLYEFNVMPFGLVNAPATFQRMMNHIISNLRWQSAMVYLDDIIIYSKTFAQHLIDLAQILQRLRDAGLKLQPSKCYFARTEINYLGFVVSQEGIKANADKLRVVAQFPVPQSQKHISAFLGLTGYYRRLIQNYAFIASPLTNLLKNEYKGIKIPTIWSKECTDAFELLKHTLMSAPVLAYPDYSGQSQFVIDTDASDIGIAATLSQIRDGVERPIAYASRTLSKAELKWNTTEKEALAILYGCQQYRPYVLGSQFLVRTDHHSLEWLKGHDKGRLARWDLLLSEFTFSIKYRKGIHNQNADVPSRTRESMAPAIDDDYTPDYAEPPCQKAVLIGEDARIHRILSLKATKSTESVPLIRQLILSAQAKDPTIKKVQAMYKKDPKKALEIYANTLTKRQAASIGIKSILMQDGLLVRVTQTKEYGEIKQVIIPTLELELQQTLLRSHHDERTAGHFGKTRTFARLVQNYYWPTMRKDVIKFCRTCLVCQHSRATQPNKYKSELLPSLPTAVNSRIAIDLITDYAQTERNNIHMLTIVDYFSKYAMAIALPNKECKTISDALWSHWIMLFGVPLEIQSDQGTEFTGDYLKRITDRLQIDHNISAPFKPSSQGLVERFNRTLKDILTAFVNDQPGTWDLHLPTALFAYNTSLSPVTGFTPFFIMFGRQARLPSSLLTGDYNDQFHDYTQYGSLLTTHLRNAHDIVRARLAEYAIQMKSRWDSKVTNFEPFKIGDRVKMYNPQMATKQGELPNSHKLKSKWQGPYTVIDVAVNENQALYSLKDPTTHREWTVNVERLAEYHGDGFLKRQRPTQPSSTNSLEVSHTLGTTQHNSNDAPAQQRFESTPKSRRLSSNIPRTIPTSQLIDPSNPSNEPVSSLQARTQKDDTSIRPRPSRKAAKAAQHKRRQSENESSEHQDEVLGEQDADYASSQPPLFKKLRFEKDTIPHHRTHTRHTEGVTQKELQREHERKFKNDSFINDASSLKEYELDGIITHYKQGNKGYRYIVKWKNPTIPNSDISRRSFSTTGILWDYWKTFPRNQKPVEFRKTTV
jgi:hypothetical protein